MIHFYSFWRNQLDSNIWLWRLGYFEAQNNVGGQMLLSSSQGLANICDNNLFYTSKY